MSKAIDSLWQRCERMLAVNINSNGGSDVSFERRHVFLPGGIDCTASIEYTKQIATWRALGATQTLL